MSTTIQLKRGTFAAWQSIDPILAAGELGLDTTNNLLKSGDGVTAWTLLPYVKVGANDVIGLSTELSSYVPLTQKAAANGVATLDANSKIPTSQVPNATKISSSVTQAAHGFTVGQAVYHTGALYALSQANNAATAEPDGIVSLVSDVNNFEVTHAGSISGLTGLTAGNTYFLSQTVAGAITDVAPISGISVPVFKAFSTTDGIVKIQRGFILP